MGTFTLNIAIAKVAMLPNQRLAIIWLSEPMHYQLVPRELNLFNLDQNHEFVPIQENIELVSAKTAILFRFHRGRDKMAAILQTNFSN